MERRKIRSRRQWAEIIGEQERSGLSAKDFCLGKSIGLANFYQWRRRARDEVSGAEGKMYASESFIDMGQIGSAGVAASNGVNPWVVTLDLGEGFKLTLERG